MGQEEEEVYITITITTIAMTPMSHVTRVAALDKQCMFI